VRQWAEPAGGMHTFQRLQAMSAEIDYRHVETNYTLTLAELSTRLRRRSLVVLFTDFLDTMTAELMIDNVARLARRHLVLGCRLCFERPVTGPIALGYAAHQGLGQFVAVG
jgi:uncharacterized protein (DUF58 family)